MYLTGCLYGYLCYFPFYIQTCRLQLQAAKPANVHEEELTPAQTKERIVALLLVFAVVIFFWMAFHQNGLTMTFFARDYTAHEVTGLDRLGFSVWNLALLIVTVYAGFSLFQSKTGKGKLISGVIATLALVVLGVNYGTMDYIAYSSSDFPTV